jgi:hypothetical protein
MIESRPLEHASVIQDGATRLLGVCDGAKTRDDAGFSRADATIGRVIVFTPVAEWSPEFAAEAADVVWHYHTRQLSDMTEALARAKAALSLRVIEDEGSADSSLAGPAFVLEEADGANAAEGGGLKAGRGAGKEILPRMGFEKGVLTMLAPGFALAKATKKVVAKLMEEGGMTWNAELAVHRLAAAELAGASLPVSQVAALRVLRRAVVVPADQVAEVDAYLDRLEAKAMPTPKASYLRLEEAEGASPLCWVAFPYEKLDAFKVALAGAPKRFGTERVGDGYQKGWWVEVGASDVADRLAKFAAECDLPLPCIGGSRARLAEIASVPAPDRPVDAPPPVAPSVAVPELFMDGDRLVIPVPRYSPRFTDWIKETAQRMAKFDKTPPGGPRWYIPAAKLAPFVALLDPKAAIYAECGQPPYAASIEVKRRLRSLTIAAAPQRTADQQAALPRQAAASASAPRF